MPVWSDDDDRWPMPPPNWKWELGCAIMIVLPFIAWVIFG